MVWLILQLERLTSTSSFDKHQNHNHKELLLPMVLLIPLSTLGSNQLWTACWLDASPISSTSRCHLQTCA